MIQVDVVNNRVLFIAEAIPVSYEPLLGDGAAVGSKKCKFALGELLLTLASCSTLALIIFLVSSASGTPDNTIHSDVDEFNSTASMNKTETDFIPYIGIDSLGGTLIEDGWPATWMKDPLSPQYQARKLVTDSSLVTVSSMSLLERYAFFVLFFATSGKTWTQSLDWILDGTSDICAWTEGVVCNDDDSSVIQLLLADNNLVGTIPREISLLSNLEVLNLYNNRMYGTIPAELGYLLHLTTLDVASNSFTGDLPDTMGHMNGLSEVFLEDNDHTFASNIDDVFYVI